MSAPGSNPLITTIIPTHRRPRLLRRAIGSVLAQTYPHLQVCVYDNASGDETPLVVEEIARADPRLKYHCHPENIGALKNFIYGMAHVATPFFSCLSDDDLILPDFYRLAVDAFEKYPQAMFVGGVTIITDEYGNPLSAPMRQWEPGLYMPPHGLVTMWEKGHPIWTAILFRQQIIMEVGLPDDRVGLPADLDFELRIAKHHAFCVIDKPCALFVAHEGAKSFTKTINDVWPGYKIMVDRFLTDSDLLLEVKARILSAWRRHIRDVITRICMYCLRSKRTEEALKAIELLKANCENSTKTAILEQLVALANAGVAARWLVSILIYFRWGCMRVLTAISRRFRTKSMRILSSYSRYLVTCPPKTGPVKM